MSQRVFLVGGHVSKFTGKKNSSDKELKDLIGDAIGESLKDASLRDASPIERIYVGNFAAELFNEQGHLGATVSERYESLMYKPSVRVEGACASGGLACAEAIRSIRGRLNHVVLAIGVEKQTEVDSRICGQYLGRAADYRRQKDVDDYLFPALFAKRAKAYLEKYPHVSMRDVSRVVEKAYSNANRNPNAHMYSRRMSIDLASSSPTFLKNQELKPYLRVADCSQVSDGAAAAIFMSESAMKRLDIPKNNVVEILDVDQGVGNIYRNPKDLCELSVCKHVVRRLLRKNHIFVHNVDVFELHDWYIRISCLLHFHSLDTHTHTYTTQFCYCGDIDVRSDRSCRTRKRY